MRFARIQYGGVPRLVDLVFDALVDLRVVVVDADGQDVGEKVPVLVAFDVPDIEAVAAVER